MPAVASVTTTISATNVERSAEWQLPAGAANMGGLGVVGDDPVLADGVPVAEISPREVSLEGCGLAWFDGQALEAVSSQSVYYAMVLVHIE